jgi:hypothetical protein
MPKIALSYRRSDSAGIAGRIFDRLTAHFGADSVFMDIDNIPYGIDFREHIRHVLAEVDTVIVVIGRNWRGLRDDGSFRIADESDPVRIEVEASLKRGILVVPVLVEGAGMPSRNELPPTLHDLTYRNAAEIDSGRDFHPHVDRLMRSLDRLLVPTPQEPKPEAPPPPAPQPHVHRALPLTQPPPAAEKRAIPPGEPLSAEAQAVALRVINAPRAFLERLPQPVTLAISIILPLVVVALFVLGALAQH